MVSQIDAVDAHIGMRIRLRRTLLAMSQERLGQVLGLTFQQVQKYERGSNRVTAGKLFKIARALDVPVSFFYDELPEGMALRLSAPSTDPSDGGMMTKRETLEFVRAYYRIKDPAIGRRTGARRQEAPTASGIGAQQASARRQPSLTNGSRMRIVAG